MKKLYFIKYAVFFLFIQMLIGSAPSYAAGSTAPDKVVGHVIWVKGTFKAQLPDSNPRTLKRQSEIYEHDTLMTDEASEGKVIFWDNDILIVSENSTIKIDQYHHALSTFAENPVVLAIKKFMSNLLRAITGTLTVNAPGGYVPKAHDSFGDSH